MRCALALFWLIGPVKFAMLFIYDEFKGVKVDWLKKVNSYAAFTLRPPIWGPT